MTVPRSSVGVTALGGMVYVVDGYDDDTWNSLDTVEVYEPRRADGNFSIQAFWYPKLRLLETFAGNECMPSQCKCRSSGFKLIHDQRLADSFLFNIMCDSPHEKFFLTNEELTRSETRSSGSTSNLSPIEVLTVSLLGQQPWTHLSVSINHPRSYAGVALLPRVA
ncbi:hypothetical protein LOAG_06911 [Loa loa]|uniref:BAH domain-containing protein n=1 Tax=Loa loa TaxID=7209 RepID=A0A1I7VZG8_LOALO|nr:hypothetical protein LOAG_06911 [Loa loa]EFO21581.1 hypothetical protein LOAG_06911 [Loa loa]